jgi:AbrB family looped-hinge helix DNA binding protein
VTVSNSFDRYIDTIHNVFVDEARRAAAAGASTPDIIQSGPASLESMKVKLDEEGRIAIPTVARERLGLKVGDALIASVEDGELRLLTIPAAVREPQAIIRCYVPEGVSLVDELLEDRRREAEAEDRE